MDARKQFVSSLESITHCPICLETFVNPKLLDCYHSFCTRCIELIAKDSLNKGGIDTFGGLKLLCPICRCEFEIPKEGVESLPRNAFLAILINSSIPSCAFDSTGRVDQKTINHSLAQVAENVSNLNMLVKNSGSSVLQNLEKIRRDIKRLKEKIENKLTSDFGDIMNQLKIFEINHEKISTYYQKTASELSSFCDSNGFDKQEDTANILDPNKLFAHVSFKPNKDREELMFTNTFGTFEIEPKISKNNLYANISFYSNTLKNHLEMNMLGEVEVKPATSQTEKKKRNTKLSLLGVVTANDLSLTRTTVGVAITDSSICTIETLSPVVNIFNKNSLKLRSSIVVAGLRNPQDMACCPGTEQLYIADSYHNNVYKVELGTGIHHDWPLDFEPMNISVQLENNKPTVWVTCMYANKLQSLDGETGEKIRIIDLQSDINNVSHALSINCKQMKDKRVLLLCHGVFSSDPKHEVIVADYKKGRMQQLYFGTGPGNDESSVNYPCYLAEVRDPVTAEVNSVLIADRCNDRILHLSFPSLTLISTFDTYNIGPDPSITFKQPNKMAYDAAKGLLIVAENDTQGHVLVFETTFKSNLVDFL